MLSRAGISKQYLELASPAIAHTVGLANSKYCFDIYSYIYTSTFMLESCAGMIPEMTAIGAF